MESNKLETEKKARMVLGYIVSHRMDRIDDIVKELSPVYGVYSEELQDEWFNKFLTVVTLHNEVYCLLTEHKQDERSYAELVLSQDAFLEEVLVGVVSELNAA